MCSYNKEDWTVLAKMAEVRKTDSDKKKKKSKKSVPSTQNTQYHYFLYEFIYDKLLYSL